MTVTYQELLDRLDLPAKVRLMTGANFWAMPEEPSIGLRQLVVADGPSGVRGFTWDERDPSASLPSATAVAATWDEDLLEQVAHVLAAEARRKGVDVVLGPTVNMHRSPRGGRHFESFSEDPLLSGRIGAAYVRALQSRGVGATPKHYVANDSETERFTLDVRVDERTLRELYLAPFEHIVRHARPWMVMAAYNEVNGWTMTESPLLAEPLKGEWDFDGAIVSDWFATRSVDAAGPGLTDLAMPGPDGPWGDALVAAVQEGRVPESAIDDHVLRLLRLAARVGALEGFAAADGFTSHLDGPEVAAIAREVAAEGMVLVRNVDRVLPLAPDVLRRVAVIGANAVDARIQGGGSAGVVPPHAISPVQGLTEALGGDVVVHALGAKLTAGLAPLDERLTRNPVTGEAGLHVRWLDGDGAEVASEERFRGHLRWKETVPSGARSVEIATRVVADVAGTWRIGIVGVGSYAVDLDGDTVFDGELEPEGDAFDAAVHAPGVFVAEHELDEGGEVALTVRMTVEGGTFGANVTIGAERPVAPPDELLGEAVAAARDADVAIVVVGTTSEVESEGFDRDTLRLPGQQDALVRAVVAVNPRTVVVVNSGAPVLLPWRDEVAAVLLSWFGGQEYGHALADVLLGVREPGGRLPTTWPDREEDVPVLDTTPVDGILAYDEGVHIGYRAWERAGVVPAYGFGAGQGYTTWSLDALVVDGSLDGSLDGGAGAASPGIRATVQMTNTGARAGKHVVQAYLSRADTRIDRPATWLAGFTVVRAEPGESVTAQVVIDRRRFEHWSPEAGGWQLEPGAFELSVGGSLADRPLRSEVVV